MLLNEFIVPPECGGQIVTVSYAYDIKTNRIWRRHHDVSDGEVWYYSAICPDSYECDFWNGSPPIKRWKKEKQCPEYLMA
jgi:hypothetical protein